MGVNSNMSFDFSNINPCGDCCDECEYKKNRECKGCREVDGKCVKLWTNECLIYKCCTRHKAYFCGICNEFPCKWIVDKIIELVQLKLNIGTSVEDSTPTEAGIRNPHL